MCFAPLDDPSKDSGPADTLGPDPPLQAVVRGASILTALQDVKCLDGLIRAHTLLGFMEPRTSPGHQENLLRAYVFVLHTWNVRTRAHDSSTLHQLSTFYSSRYLDFKDFFVFICTTIASMLATKSMIDVGVWSCVTTGVHGNGA